MNKGPSTKNIPIKIPTVVAEDLIDIPPVATENSPKKNKDDDDEEEDDGIVIDIDDDELDFQADFPSTITRSPPKKNKYNDDGGDDYNLDFQADIPPTIMESPPMKNKDKDDDGDELDFQCDQYADFDAARSICEVFCTNECYLDMASMGLKNGNARKSAKGNNNDKDDIDEYDAIFQDLWETYEDYTCAELKESFEMITLGDEFPCQQCPCWSKADLIQMFPEPFFIAGDSCIDLLPGDGTLIYISNDKQTAFAQDGPDGLLDDGAHHCVLAGTGSENLTVSITETETRMCVKSLVSHCETLGYAVVEQWIPPV